MQKSINKIISNEKISSSISPFELGGYQVSADCRQGRRWAQQWNQISSSAHNDVNREERAIRRMNAGPSPKRYIESGSLSDYSPAHPPFWRNQWTRNSRPNGYLFPSSWLTKQSLDVVLVSQTLYGRECSPHIHRQTLPNPSLPAANHPLRANRTKWLVRGAASHRPSWTWLTIVHNELQIYDCEINNRNL